MDGTGRDPADGPDGDAPGADGDGYDAAGGLSAAPTIYDVARAAGVSIASVSRVLNGQRNPRQETRDRVLAAVAELGFAPDGAARALSARFKEVVGVIVTVPGPRFTSVVPHPAANDPVACGKVTAIADPFDSVTSLP